MGIQVVIIVGMFILLITGLLLGYVLAQLVLGYLGFNLFTLLGTASLILIFGTLYYVLFWQLRREKSLTSLTRPNSRLEIAKESMADGYLYLKQQLIAKLGDHAAAERLVDQAKANYPGMPDNWYWERVLDDLERDQR